MTSRSLDGKVLAVNTSERPASPSAEDVDRERRDFANRHTLVHFPSRAAYTFIPKNGCSTLRFSLAVANGFLEPDSDPNWIHDKINSGSPLFRASERDRANAPYTFIVLRDPHRRLASAFLDKFLQAKFPAIQHVRRVDPALATRDEIATAISTMTFSSFVEALTEFPRFALDEHFRPQVDFLNFEEYTRWFSLEKFTDAADTLKSDIGFDLYDTRRLSGHNTSELTAVEGDFAKTTVDELRAMRASGTFPASASLYTDRVRRLVTEYYADDIDVYSAQIGEEGLLFAHDPEVST